MAETAQASVPAAPGYERPAFLDKLRDAYSDRGKGVIVLSGNTNDRFWCNKLNKFASLEQTLFRQYAEHFSVIRVDCAAGIDDYDGETIQTLSALCKKHDAAFEKGSSKRIGELEYNLAQNRNSPLATVQLLAQLLEVVYKMREKQKKENKEGVTTANPVCAIVQFSGKFFPQPNGELNEVDRLKLVTFLNLLLAPWFENSNHMIILVTNTCAQLNKEITELPSVEAVEIGFPTDAEREKFTKTFPTGTNSQPLQFDRGIERFVAETAGLPLTALQEVLKAASRSGKPITRKQVLDQLAAVVKAQLPGIAKLKVVEHTTDDVVGYKKTGVIWRHTFKRCETKATAVPVVIVSGPNGGGKTYQAEAYASESGRLVLVLTGLRSKWFGETDQVFEKLSLLLRSLGNVLIIVDEADSKFGSAHNADVHETERRLAGSLIEMMGDPSMFGKVIWLLATSRPDLLETDILSRSPVQIPIFDLEDAERSDFVKALFARKKIAIPEDDLPKILEKTKTYSNRDFGFLVAEVLSRNISVLETLNVWQATSAIRAKRTAQEVIAAQNCSYPELLPVRLANRIGSKEFEADVQAAKLVLAA
jgi:AAA+ superfamily predicted ATPase